MTFIQRFFSLSSFSSISIGFFSHPKKNLSIFPFSVYNKCCYKMSFVPD